MEAALLAKPKFAFTQADAAGSAAAESEAEGSRGSAPPAGPPPAPPYPLRPPQSPPEPGRGQKPGRPGTGKRASTRPLSCDSCAACPEPRYKGAWCRKHHRAAQNCYSHAFTKYGISTGQDIAYKQIFGSRDPPTPMDETVAAQVVCDYCQQFGDGGGAGNSRSGLSRGKVELTSYIDTKGYRTAQEEEDDGMVKIDKEAFITSMKTTRGWGVEKATQEWNELYHVEGAKIDNKGYKGAERLKVPSSLFAGLDREYNKNSHYQDKSVSTHTKPAALSDKDREALEARINSGFSKDLRGQTDFSSLFTGNHNQTSSADPKFFLAKVAQQRGLATATEAGQQALSPRKAGASASACDGLGSPGPAISACDMASLRNKSYAKADKEVKCIRSALQADLAAACTVLRLRRTDTDKVFAGTLLELLNFVSTFLGVTIKDTIYAVAQQPAKEDDQQVTPEKLQTQGLEPLDLLKVATARRGEAAVQADPTILAIYQPPNQGGSKMEAEFSRRVNDKEVCLAEALLKDRPVEKPQTLQSLKGLQHLAADIEGIRTPADLEAHNVKFEEQMSLYKQMRKALRNATRDLKARVNNRKKEEEAKQVEMQKKADEEARKRQAEADVANAKKVAKVYNSALFSLSFGGQHAIQTYRADNVGALDCRLPFVVAGAAPNYTIDAVEQVAEASRSTLQHALVGWSGVFPNQEIYCKEDKISAPFEHNHHGSDELQAIFASILAPDGPIEVHDLKACKELQPAEATSWFGYAPNLVFFGMEPHAMGVLRVVAAGSLKVVMVAPTTMLKAFPGESCQALLEHWRLSTAETVADLSKHGGFYYGIINAGDIAYTPTGWLVGYMPANSAGVCGLRRACLPVEPKGKEDGEGRQVSELKALATALGKDKEVKIMSDLLVKAIGFLEYASEDSLQAAPATIAVEEVGSDVAEEPSEG